MVANFTVPSARLLDFLSVITDKKFKSSVENAVGILEYYNLSGIMKLLRNGMTDIGLVT